MSDNIPDAWRTIAPYIEDPPESSVLVMGGGGPSVAFYSIGMAKALGVEHIDFIDHDPGRLAKAERLGADVFHGAADAPRHRYTVTVCSVRDRDALVHALRATEPDGTCVCNTIFFDGDVALPMLDMYTHGIRLVTGRVNARAAMPAALDLVSQGRLRPELVTDALVDWDDAPDALASGPRKFVIQR